METITKKFYLKLGISEKALSAINKELALTAGLKLSPFARSRRAEMLKEAISFPKGEAPRASRPWHLWILRFAECGTRRSFNPTSHKASQDTRPAFIHGLTAVAFCEGG